MLDSMRSQILLVFFIISLSIHISCNKYNLEGRYYLINTKPAPNFYEYIELKRDSTFTYYSYMGVHQEFEHGTWKIINETFYLKSIHQGNSRDTIFQSKIFNNEIRFVPKRNRLYKNGEKKFIYVKRKKK